MTTLTNSAEQKALKTLRSSFVESASKVSKAKNFRNMIEAVCAKIDKSTLSTAKQAVKHANAIMSQLAFLNKLSAVESVNSFFAHAKNIKAINYISVLSDRRSNNYLTLTMKHIADNENATTESVCKMLQEYYSAATASAQKSMCVNALRAVDAIAFDDTTKAKIERSANFDFFAEQCAAHQVTRSKIS